MAAGFVYDRLGEDRKAAGALRAGREARRQGQSRRAQQRRGVPVPQGRQEAGRGVLPAGGGEPAVPHARGRLPECRAAARAPTDGRRTPSAISAQALAIKPNLPRRRCCQIGDLLHDDGQRPAGARLPAALPRRRTGHGRVAVARLPRRDASSATPAAAEEYARRLRRRVRRCRPRPASCSTRSGRRREPKPRTRRPRQRRARARCCAARARQRGLTRAAGGRAAQPRRRPWSRRSSATISRRSARRCSPRATCAATARLLGIARGSDLLDAYERARVRSPRRRA